MGPKDAPVAVGLIHNHILELAQKASPAGMIGQDSVVQHIRVSQNKVGALANKAAVGLRGVAVVALSHEPG